MFELLNEILIYSAMCSWWYSLARGKMSSK